MTRTPAEGLRLGIMYADGRRAATSDGHPRPDDADPGWLMLFENGGGGSSRTWDGNFWVHPLPPDGPVTFVVSWAEHGWPRPGRSRTARRSVPLQRGRSLYGRRSRIPSPAMAMPGAARWSPRVSPMLPAQEPSLTGLARQAGCRALGPGSRRDRGKASSGPAKAAPRQPSPDRRAIGVHQPGWAAASHGYHRPPRHAGRRPRRPRAVRVPSWSSCGRSGIDPARRHVANQ